MRRLVIALAAVVVAATVAIGLVQAGGGREEPRPSADYDPARDRAALRGAPPALARLHRQAGALLTGGRPAFERRLRELRGYPVVINKWASWCAPCRFEFPFFARAAVARGREVAFLGLDSGDQRGPAERFLRERPVPFPSYEDPGEEIARAVGAPANYPVTVFLDARGRRVYAHQGAYPSQRALLADIRRYAKAG